MTQKEKNFYNNYERSNMYRLSDLYKSCSYEKSRADYLIREEMKNLNGYDYKIISGNSMMFSCGYKYKDQSNLEHLVYHTRYSRYDILLNI